MNGAAFGTGLRRLTVKAVTNQIYCRRKELRIMPKTKRALAGMVDITFRSCKTCLSYVGAPRVGVALLVFYLLIARPGAAHFYKFPRRSCKCPTSGTRSIFHFSD